MLIMFNTDEYAFPREYKDMLKGQFPEPAPLDPDASDEDRMRDALNCTVHAQTQTDEYHYFVSSALHWHVGFDLFELLKRQYKADNPRRSTGYRAKGCKVYRVPGPITAHYNINGYHPDVEGAVLIDSIDYDHKFKMPKG